MLHVLESTGGGGYGDKAQHILNIAIRRVLVVNFPLRPLYHQGKIRGIN
jgi:hypothetical protein